MNHVLLKACVSCPCHHSGTLPLVSKGTHIIIPLVEELQDERWEAKIVEQSVNRVKLSVNSSITAVIGKYKLTVATQCLKTGETTTHDPDKDIYMLFNPWCEGKTKTLCSNICDLMRNTAQ